jgi:RimJ/RimL family protein N-acetyltransferase
MTSAAARTHVAFRPAAPGDCEMLWHWRNEPAAREASFDTRAIALEEHRPWFERLLADATRRLWIVTADGEPAGYVRVDRRDERGVVSVGLAPEWRGRGVGSAALAAIGARARAELGVDRLVAEIKRDNPGSLGAFRRAGFRLLEETPRAIVLGRETAEAGA